MSEWISVDEDLPSDLEAVLAVVHYGCVVVLAFQDGRFVQDSTQAELYESEPLGDIFEQPTHWMKLPEPPEDS